MSKYKSKYKSKSYEQCHCHGDCYMLKENKDNKDSTKPCWGEVEAIEELDRGNTDIWIHSCQGHFDCYESVFGEYKEEISG